MRPFYNLKDAIRRFRESTDNKYIIGIDFVRAWMISGTFPGSVQLGGEWYFDPQALNDQAIELRMMRHERQVKFVDDIKSKI